MKEYGAAATGDRGLRIVINLDDEIIEMIITAEPVASLVLPEVDGPIVTPAVGVFTPGVFRADRANGQKGRWPRVTVGAPPQPPGPESTARSTAVALALVGNDSAASQGHRNQVRARHQPAPGMVSGRSTDINRRQ